MKTSFVGHLASVLVTSLLVTACGSKVAVENSCAEDQDCSKSTVENFCAKSQECWPNGTKEQCIANISELVSGYPNQPNCKPVADSWAVYFECQTPLSCAELTSALIPLKCKKQFDDTVAARDANPSCMPLNTDTTSSTTAGAGGGSTSSSTAGAGGGMM